MRIERTIVQIGVRADGVTGANAGHPGLLERLNVSLVPADEGSWSAGTPAFPAGSRVTIEQAAVPVGVPRRFADEGPVFAIAIAPDSPIEACDIYIGGNANHVHRIGVGAPYIGTIDENKEILVAPVRDSAPPVRRDFMLGVITGDRQRQETSFWDMTFVNLAAGGLSLVYPIRLEFYRGQRHEIASAIPVLMQKRARYSANMIYEVVDRGGAVPSRPALTAIVDGRSKIRIVAGKGVVVAGTAQLHVYGIEGRSGHLGDRVTAAPAGLPIDWPVYDELLPATATPAVPGCLIFDYPGGATGNPYWAIECAIEAGTIGERGFISIHAWD